MTPIRFKSIGQIILSVASMLAPEERLSVAQAAERYRKVYQPGAISGDWRNSTTPMMVEPMNEFGSRRFKGIAYVGPAQSGKTDSLVLNTLAWTVRSSPMDIMLVCPSIVAARDFSIRRIDRLHRYSPEIGEKQLPGADNDNKFDKQYVNGMMFTLSWPTPIELAGKPIGRVLMTDFDRMPEDVGPGDGNPYDLASQRTTTFGSYAMTLAESSPSKEITDLKWIPRTLHEAPPTTGILALYNRGDRRRWYWPCPDCGKYFEGKFAMLKYQREEGMSNLDAADTVRLHCPHCSYPIHPDERDAMQQRGQWVKDGQAIDDQGNVFGPTRRTRIASFWQNGVSASFEKWSGLVALYLDALDDYENTGSEEALKKFYNNNLGEPYYPKSTTDRRLPEVLKARAEPMLARMVPPDVRFLMALVDVQKNMFVVQVVGVIPGKPFDMVLIDRFDIRKSKRLDEDDDPLWVKPHTYLEDWDLLIEEVMQKRYPLSDGSGMMMRIKQTACDSGGRDGVTTKAYEFYRSLKARGLERRFILVKGDHAAGQPRTRISYPDASRRDNKAGARGDVPVLLLNSNMLKDDLDGRLDSMTPGRGMIRFPDWLPDPFYLELCAEVRTPQGWQNTSGKRNESWDLLYYAIGVAVSELVAIDRLDWDNPPRWAAQWDANEMIDDPAEEREFAIPHENAYDFSQFGKSLA